MHFKECLEKKGKPVYLCANEIVKRKKYQMKIRKRPKSGTIDNDLLYFSAQIIGTEMQAKRWEFLGCVSKTRS